ncbi:hypothetical protein CAEBREN_17951 [Caenorhabditis brenneri]|uniref:F-box domain-containing protein n=1 Tax=Caenorhabditis brenneri TaxID=135651 RepID=G0MUI5_CAEBE|nr:hypothetical protein CAEBREN_17951 [Caenorhabditis brenneri]
MQTFKLLGLPGLAFEQVANKLDAFKIIVLTTVSKKFKRKIQGVKLKVSTLKWNYPCSININSSQGSIGIEISGSAGGEIKRINGTPVRIDTFPINSHQTQLFVNPACPSSTRLTVMEDVTIHLLSIFQVRHFNFVLWDKTLNPDISSIFIWKYCQDFLNFYLCDTLRPQISPEEMTFLSRNVKAETLHIGKLTTNFQHKETFNCKQLELINPCWATPECLNSDQYTDMIIRTQSSTYNHFFNGVLKNWMQGRHQKLESFFATTSLWIGRTTLDGIEQIPTSFSKEELQLRSRYWHPEIGCVDIRRPTDGRLATVQMSYESILLLGWHEKHFEHVSEETKTKLRRLKLI